MKLYGYRVCCICITALLLLSGFACADEIDPTITHLFFEKDGRPFNESVHFTVDCYGYAWKMWDASAPEDRIAKVNHSSELVYSYSASCPSYGCTIYEPFYHAERIYGDHCDVKGQAGGTDFFIRNYSLSPIPNCTELHQVDIGKGHDNYYKITSEYSRCVNDTRRKAIRCDHYLVPCEPGKDYDCGYWVVDGNYVKETPSYRACKDTIDREMADCDQFLKKLDTSTMIMWTYNDYRATPAMRECELRFTIPSSGQATSQDQRIPGVTAGAPVSATIRYQSPVESLYCSILNFFGIRCS